MSSKVQLRDLISVVRKTKYPVEAFVFVQEGLDYTINRLHGPSQDVEPDESRHISGQDLCRGLRDFALSQYGLMAKVVLNYWAIYDSLDFGRIVYIMIDAGMMSKTDGDSLDDFREVYAFADAFSPELSLDD